MPETSLLELETKATDPSRLSVQSRANDSQVAPTSDVNGAGLFWVTVGSALDEEPHWNAIYPNWRDRYLLNFSRTEGMLASAVYSMKTRIGTLDYEVNGPPRAKKFAQDLLKAPGLGDSFREVVQKISGDLDTSDNGAFMELWRPGKPDSDAGTRPVLGFAHLDSRQCWRSFDPEFPVWYTHPVTGQIRKLHRSRVAFSADNPQSVELARGIGFCATSRTLLMARTFRSMQIFLNEKVSGRFTRAIGGVSGINPQQLRAALAETRAEADNMGFVVYQNIPFLVNPNTEQGNEIKIMLQDLASIPDGFVFRDDADLYAYILAFAFGVDAREFWPATQSGATKADASVQNMKAQGRGIGNRIETVADMIRRALPETVEFEFDYTDDAQDDQAAKINQTRATTYDMMVKNGTITAQESRAMSIAVGILDQTVLDTMVAPATSDSNPDMPEPAALPQPGTQPDNAQDTNKAADNSAFVYVPLPNDSGILEIQQRVRNVLGINGIEYQDPETFHVTLLYCTEATGDQLQKVIDSSPVSSQLTIASKRLGLFENGDERALYLEVERDSNLVTLQSNVFQAFTQNGLGNQLSSFSSPGSYKPHITLAYLPPGVDIPNLSVNLSTTAARYSFSRSEYQIIATKQKDGAAQKSVSMYRKSMRDAVRGLWSGALSQYDFHVSMGAAINRQFPLAWNEGAAKFGITDTERSDEEEQRLTLEINTEISYIAGFGLDIMDNSKENGGALQPLLDRAELWVNSYERIVVLAGTMAAADQKGEWVYGDTQDHCPSCSGYAGRVYRNSTWRKYLEPYDLMPKGKGLACGGWYCDCGIKPTDKPITRGRPPIIQKMLHNHVPEALSA